MSKCKTCKHNREPWYSEACDGCCGSEDNYEADLISRQWLLEVYGDYIGDNGETKYHVPLEVVRQNIKDAPSAEPKIGEWIEVVRCKDCKNWNEWENGVGSCHRSENRYNWFGTNMNDYCSFGERIDE